MQQTRAAIWPTCAMRNDLSAGSRMSGVGCDHLAAIWLLLAPAIKHGREALEPLQTPRAIKTTRHTRLESH